MQMNRDEIWCGWKWSSNDKHEFWEWNQHTN
jgi:hypothetical protein